MPEIRKNRVLRLLDEGAETLRGVSETPRLDAEVIMAFALGMDRTAVLLNPPENAPKGAAESFMEGIRRRSEGEPVAYITGKKDFFKSSFAVNRSVLIPRPETETLVEAVLARHPAEPSLSVCDVGTGSGCIAVSLALERPRWDIAATDVSPAALEVALGNAERLGAGNVRFVLSDLFESVTGRFDVIASNPPYVDSETAATLPPGVRKYEPATALFAGGGGLSAIERIFGLAPSRLNPGGRIYCEIGFDQKEVLEKILSRGPWEKVEFLKDLAGRHRVATASIGERK